MHMHSLDSTLLVGSSSRASKTKKKRRSVGQGVEVSVQCPGGGGGERC